MEIIGTALLDAFTAKHTDAKKPVEAWCSIVRNATWARPQDIKNQFRTVDFLKNNRAIFNIKGNHYRIVVQVRYVEGKLSIEWIGTHAEYSRKKLN